MSIIKATSPIALSGSHYAVNYAATLLQSLGADTVQSRDQNEHALVNWQRSGLLALCGPKQQAGLACPVPLPDCADGVLLALRSLSSAPRLDKIDAAALLSERARLMELGRSGPVSPGGTCRIINTATKPIALNMARETDWQMLPALFKHDCVASWAAIIEHCQQTEADALVEQGRVLGMAITNCPSELAGDDWLITEHFSATRRSALKRPRVLDLSSLWAGPLCSSLLHFLVLRCSR
jgi:hypothetical protein